MKNSALTSSYFKSNFNFNLIKKVCKANADLFVEKKKKYLFHYFHIFILVWRILSSLQSFIHGKFSVENSIQWVEFFPVRRRLSSA